MVTPRYLIESALAVSIHLYHGIGRQVVAFERRLYGCICWDEFHIPLLLPQVEEVAVTTFQRSASAGSVRPSRPGLDSGTKFHEPGSRAESGHIIYFPGPGQPGPKFYWPGAGPAQLYCPGLRKSRIFSIFKLYQQEYIVSTN